MLTRKPTVKIARWMLCILTLSAVIVGCGEDKPDEHAYDPDWWDIVSINGELKRTFGNYNANGGVMQTVVFSDTDWFRHEFSFCTFEIYAGDHSGAPETSMQKCISYTTRGSYTTQGNILTMTKTSTAWNVDVSLEPEAVWQEKIEGMTLEEHKSKLAAEMKKELQQVILPLFKDDTEYTWRVDGGQLTLSSPQQTIVLFRGAID